MDKAKKGRMIIMSDLISVIVPCYNEEVSLPFFYKEIQKVISHMQERYPVEFELLFVDDGSRDDTLSIIKSFASKDPKIKYLSFSRNFGKESAILAGLEHATGDYVALMDADLQDPPSLLTQMYETIKEGTYDCIGTKRVDRKGEPPIRSFFARCFYKLINKISKTSIVDGARDFRLMTRQMTDAILNMPEYNRFSKGIFGWVGFKTKWLEYTNVERVAGSTKWSFWSLFLYSLDGIVAFSTIPLSIASILGILFFVYRSYIYHCNYCKNSHLGRPGSGLSIHDVRDLPAGWSSAILNRYSWTISVQNISGS